MVGVLAVGFVANLLIRPVDSPLPRVRARDHDSRGADRCADDRRSRRRTTSRRWLLPVAWAVVGVPLAYGVYETVVKAIDLFG